MVDNEKIGYKPQNTERGQAALGRVFTIFLSMGRRVADISDATRKLTEASAQCNQHMADPDARLYDSVANIEQTHRHLKSISDKLHRIVVLIDEVTTEWKELAKLANGGGE
jgi:hypothetical protein